MCETLIIHNFSHVIEERHLMYVSLSIDAQTLFRYIVKV